MLPITILANELATSRPGDLIALALKLGRIFGGMRVADVDEAFARVNELAADNPEEQHLAALRPLAVEFFDATVALWSTNRRAVAAHHWYIVEKAFTLGHAEGLRATRPLQAVESLHEAA